MKPTLPRRNQPRLPRIPWVFAGVWLLFALVSAPTLAQKVHFPYQALVLRGGVTVHSGPGASHYTTDELNADTVVQVWRHDPDGWLAIRPPAGSFSMIPEAAVEIIAVPLSTSQSSAADSAQRGRIIADMTQVWVGTRTGPVESPLWQVKLKQGEEIVILGSTSWPNPDGTTATWLQIAPPAGEFRWIHREHVQLPDERLTLPADDTTIAGDAASNPAAPMVGAPTPAIAYPQAIGSRARGGDDNDQTDDTHLGQASETGDSQVRQVNWIENPFGDEQDPALNGPRNNRGGSRLRNVFQRGNPRTDDIDREILSIEDPGVNELETFDRENSLGGGVTDNNGWRRATRPFANSGSQVANGSAGSMGGGQMNGNRQFPADTGPIARTAALPSNDALSGNLNLLGNSTGSNSSSSSGNTAGPITMVPDINATPVATPLTEVLADRLGQLDNQISMEIIKPVENWQLQRLIDQLVQIQATATTDQERQQSLWLQSKLERLRVTQQQLLAAPGMSLVGLGGGVINRGGNTNLNGAGNLGAGNGGGSTAGLDRMATGPAGMPVGTGVDPTVQNGSLYDAYGWLAEFHQDHGRGPVGYVLQDDQGRITHHLEAAPGFNLGRYVKSKVGVIGTRGYNQRLKLSHVTVDRVVVLESKDSARR